ncbi:hypothetical protein Slit_0077 [Sideroxydans lithotrophicus ES-1]|uniref:Uncharacterized protein n=1 Tax=Sideroxydans lithotrophicus (strain ES-1) TaxID=580332 RepID=D5CTL3_SIDLE|nr:hypothetical protein Slit_0077 [Sideroxydans lithotrophicus ES-1]
MSPENSFARFAEASNTQHVIYRVRNGKGDLTGFEDRRCTPHGRPGSIGLQGHSQLKTRQ